MVDQGLTRKVREVVFAAKRPIHSREVCDEVLRTMPDAKQHSICAILVTSAQKGFIRRAPSRKRKGKNVFSAVRNPVASTLPVSTVLPAGNILTGGRCRIVQATIVREAGEPGGGLADDEMELSLWVRLVPGKSLAATLSGLEAALAHYQC